MQKLFEIGSLRTYLNCKVDVIVICGDASGDMLYADVV